MQMRRYLLLILTGILMSGLAHAQDDWANIGRYAQANSEMTVRPKAVFMGDSITQCWYDADPSFFNDNNFAIGGGYNQFFNILVWAYSLGATEEVYHHQIDE